MQEKIGLPVNRPVEEQDYEFMKRVLVQLYIDNGCKLPLWPSIPRLTGLDKERILKVFCHNNGWKEAERMIPEFAKEELGCSNPSEPDGTRKTGEHDEPDQPNIANVTASKKGDRGLAKAQHRAVIEFKTLQQAEKVEQPENNTDATGAPQSVSSPEKWLLTDEELSLDESNLVYFLTYDEDYSRDAAEKAIYLVKKRNKTELDQHLVRLLETDEVKRCLIKQGRRRFEAEFLRTLLDVITQELGHVPTTKEMVALNMHLSIPSATTFRKHSLL